MNSKSSEDSEWVLTMFSQSIECLILLTVRDETKSEETDVLAKKSGMCLGEQ